MTSYNVSSSFVEQVRSKSPTILRKILIGGSDYSDYVTKWPTVSREWNRLKPNKVTINFANQENDFNFFKTSPITLTNSCSIQVGVQHAVGSEELINIFDGTVGRVSYMGGNCSVSFIDKTKAFSERVLGTRETPIDFTSSNHNPADMAWILVTSYGGLSNVESTSNPDIDYEAWQEWWTLFDDDSVVTQGYFDGIKVSDAMRRIGRMTASSIFEENSKLSFYRWSNSSLEPYSLHTGEIKKVNMSIDDLQIINDQIVNADFDVTSKLFNIAVNDVDTPSVNSYGLRQFAEEDRKFWYVNSVSALNLAQREVSLKSEPIENYRVTTAGIQPLARQIGDTVGLIYGFLGSSDTYRIMKYKLDIDKLEYELTLNTSQLTTFFTLDDATNGLLDQAYNPLA